ncbi:MAG TPA: serine hydrolase domain-containing protein [Acidobacteriaceae bacterium]|nr:serine hydrolase domain-containing protein [Acidobacteriaceae bacterium]
MKSASQLSTFRGTIDEALLRAHVMLPKYQQGAMGDRGPQSPGAPAARPPQPRPRILTHLNPTNFQYGVLDALGDACVGYCMQLRQHGAVVVEQNYNFAQQAVGAGPNTPWTFDTPMHVGSLSKMITAMSITRVLNAVGVSPNNPINPYLPAYWTQGANISEITFANLLTHTSGLTSGATDYESMKAAIAAGVTSAAYGQYAYANMNFSLCRILLSVLNGNVSVDYDPSFLFMTGGILEDVFWDYYTTADFQQYVAANVFSPSSSSGHMVHQPGDALAYDFPTSSTEVGYNDGDLTYLTGAGGWHMSANQFLNVMGTFRRGGSILSTQQAQTMLDNGFGIDWTYPTSAGGSYYSKNGSWTINGQTEQAVAFYLPEDMELVVLVNSPVGDVPSVPLFLYSVISDVYLANLG